MKVLFVFNHPAPYKINLLNSLSKYCDLKVLFERNKNKDRSSSFYYNNNYDFSYEFIKGIAFNNENHFGFALKNYIKKHHQEYDLIIMNGYSTMSEIIAIKYMIKHKIAYSLYVNGGIIKNDKKSLFNLKHQLISNAQHYFSPSEKANEYLVHYGAKKEKIYNYVYSTIFESEIIDEEKLNKKQTYNFVTFGQFIPRKNNQKLLEIFVDLPSKYHLTIIGEGEEETKYNNFIKENGLETRIEVLPFLKHDTLLKKIRAYDYFITLSKEDIYGHMVNEALSQGLPVICSNKVVSAYKLINGKDGFIVDISNDQDIISAIEKVNRLNPINCLEVARENTIEKMVESHVKILKELEK